MILDSEVSAGAVRFPRRSAVKQQVLHQGTTSVVFLARRVGQRWE